MNDEEIVELYLARDERAIKESSDKYGKKLQHLSWQIVGDEGTAEECVNDTWLKTWESIPPHEPRDYFFAFIAKITRNLSISRYRQNSASKRSANIVSLDNEMEEFVGGEDDAEKKIDEIHFKDSLNSFLAELSEEKRDIFVRRYFYADDIGSIAERHGCSESRITTMLLRMRKKLREHLENDGIYV